ncbi:MAG: methyltransferase, partial [Actinobacteria bacterium]|nr:methyltransferase [Actinomycetota bacterium]NIU71314.1 methyltransferase [Actinomycetota bacterium]NIW33268.1 methyltransferase [Actinomycetota bacterium]NIX19450.1 methyltransferase [Actinomycetota bacterium]
EVAVTGGETGREVIARFLDGVGRVLAPGGVVYLLVSSYTGVDAVVERAGANGFGAAALADVTFPGETL